MKVYEIDDILQDRYEIFGYRKGGMGIVYFVNDIKTGKAFAAKTYKSQNGKNDIDARFHKELELSIQLGEHENILSIHFLKKIDGQVYLFTDYVDGGGLGSTILERLYNDAISPEAAISFAYQICNGMEFLSSKQKIAHLDLKPSNILITQDNVAKIADFGLSRALDLFRIRPTPENAGTIPYMSPEHFNGQIVDTRSDIYSFGVIFYEMLTGRHPAGLNLRNKSKTEIYEFFKKFHSSQKLGKALYWHGLPEVKQQGTLRDTLQQWIDPQNYRGNDLGVILGGCLERLPEKRFYEFRYVREALELIFGGHLKVSDGMGSDQVAPMDEIQRALDFQELGQHDKALRNLNKVLKMNPRNAYAWLAAAVSLWHIGRQTDALVFAQKAADLKPASEQFRRAVRYLEEDRLREEADEQIAKIFASRQG
jgi:serine/threonine protein kinase